MSAAETRLSDPTVPVSVIVPAASMDRYLPACLRALSALSPSPLEVILVLDGWGDGGGARDISPEGAVFHRLPERVGPAKARNAGAGLARGEVLLFLDADVLAPPDTVGRVFRAFEEQPGLDALFGCYDDAPEAPGLVSQYRNLLHHHTHMTGREEASTFWTGCGAVRREAFLALGGFDERHTRPSMEDVEFGCRVKRWGGRIRLVKTLQVKHLKEWRLLPMIRCDLLDRAVPWTRIALRDRCLVNDLNLRTASRLSVGLTAALPLILAGGFASPWLLAAAAAIPPALAALNAPFYRFLCERRGGWFALGAAPLHGLYHLCCGLGFAAGCIQHVLTGARGTSTARLRDGTVRTYPEWTRDP